MDQTTKLLSDFGSRLRELAKLISRGLSPVEKASAAEYYSASDNKSVSDAKKSEYAYPSGFHADAEMYAVPSFADDAISRLPDEGSLRYAAEKSGAQRDYSAFAGAAKANQYGSIGLGESGGQSDIYRGFRNRLERAAHEVRLLNKLTQYESSLNDLLSAAQTLSAQQEAVKRNAENDEMLQSMKNQIDEDKQSDYSRIAQAAKNVGKTLDTVLPTIDVGAKALDSIDYQREAAETAASTAAALRALLDDAESLDVLPEPIEDAEPPQESPTAEKKETAAKQPAAAKKTTTTKKSTTTKSTTTKSTTDKSGKSAIDDMPSFGMTAKASALGAYYKSEVLKLSSNGTKTASAKDVYILTQKARAEGASDDYLQWMHKVCGVA